MNFPEGYGRIRDKINHQDVKGANSGRHHPFHTKVDQCDEDCQQIIFRLRQS